MSAPYFDAAPDWYYDESEAEAEARARADQREREEQDTADYLQTRAIELAKAIGTQRVETIRRQLARIWREAQRVSKVHKTLGVEPPQ
jgi:hypothetical protein